MLDGKRHGKWVLWYRNGQKQLEGAYEKGEKTGNWEKWAENGVKVTQGEFAFGKMHGLWTDWHGNGCKALESRWFYGKRDGKWSYWRPDGSLEKKVDFEHSMEEDKGYSIHTDLEAKQLVRKIQRQRVQKNWERLVGKSVARFVKPWHAACWVLAFVPLFSLVEARTPWRGALLAGILALVLTGLLGCVLDRKGPK